MKLIDLLVQELPKRGGWPDGAISIVQDCDGDVKGVAICHSAQMNERGVWVRSGGNLGTLLKTKLADDYAVAIINREQYESALAAAQKPAWNGEGLPPAGCECEWRDDNVGWLPVTIKYISEQVVVMASPTNLCGVRELTEIAKDIICDRPQFRPLRTEADKKRDEAVKAILETLNYYDFEMVHIRCDQKQVATEIIDAIAAGKIPGVKLDD